jgi:SAM-dependent methyltransferase
VSAAGRGYWDANAAALTFTHPLNLDWLPALPKAARILDYGCGYGRTLAVAEPDGAYDAVILFAVLTTIPDDDEQRALMAELRRLIRPGGLLYVSDYLLQTDARNLARYEAGAARHGVYGVWDREDGGVFRHQTRAALDDLMEGFELVAEADVATTTFSGAPATAIQRLARRLRPR